MIIATEVKERPILFSGEMVRAILEGRKTVTRRVMKPQPSSEWISVTAPGVAPYERLIWGKKTPVDSFGNWLVRCNVARFSDYAKKHCPYGTEGDRLWVRETWAEDLGGFIYRADGVWNTNKSIKWKSSMFMPRKASRLTLEITRVGVERLQDISEGQSQKEGWDMSNLVLHHAYDPVSMNKARQWFQVLWNSINGDRPGYDWDSNPWVWVVEFKPYATA